MAAHPSWKGFLQLSLVAIPVKAYSAHGEGGPIQLNQLHAECNSRIKYKKTCPVHGEVTQDEIVSGYEYAKGQYVVVDPEELDKLRSEDEKALRIDTFIDPGAVDPIYMTEKSSYLVPDGPVAIKGYTVVHKAMVEEDRHAIARVVLHGREHTVLLRPAGNLLLMTALYRESQVNKPAQFGNDVPRVEAPEEMEMTKTLIDASTAKNFDFSKYRDVYTDKLTKLIEAKVAGAEIVAPPVHEQAQIINLMDALRQSVNKVKGGAEQEEAAKPPKKVTASKRPAGDTRKKKSS
jgi:DNA end-binding protein Ku